MEKIALVIAIISLLLSIFVVFETISLEDEIDVMKTQIHELEVKNSELENQTLKLQNQVDTLQNELNTLQDEFNSTIVSQQIKIEKLMNNLQEYDAELKSRLQWISENSNIAPYEEFEKSYLDKCVVNDEINLGCVWYVIHDIWGIEYKKDVGNSNDTLYNLTEIYNRGGGDCEDLSLLFASTVRYLMEKEQTHRFVGWKEGNEKFVIYKTSSTEYYMPNAKAVHFIANRLYVTCYSLNSSAGHCIVSFCENKTTNFSECINVEPQAYGEIKSIGPLLLFISTNDLCMDVNGAIECFTDFEKEIGEILK